MPDATSLHHCLQNHQQYCIILSCIRALNINTLQKRGCNIACVVLLKLRVCVVSHVLRQ